MKRILLACIMVIFSVGVVHAAGQIVQSTGADGEFAPTANIVVALPEDGILHYTSVNIPAGVTVTFTGNARNTPVYILSQGDITVKGIISVTGSNAVQMLPGEGGPGGYAGGFGGQILARGSDGLGIGGGSAGIVNTTSCSYHKCTGSGASYSTAGKSPITEITTGETYGNEHLLPLVGGSGGGGGAGTTGRLAGGGGGGGGAILLASNSGIRVFGRIEANGGSGVYADANAGYGGCGSGGAIRLVADYIYVMNLKALGGCLNDTYRRGGNGWIRVEANRIDYLSGSEPQAITDLPGPIFYPKMPSIEITSVAGQVISNATGSYGAPDVVLNTTGPTSVEVVVSAVNVPVGAQVTIVAIPRAGARISTVAALSGTEAASTASGTLSIDPTVTTVIMAHTVYKLQTALNYEGEVVDRAMLVASAGGEARVVYLTESGREIQASELLAFMQKG